MTHTTQQGLDQDLEPLRIILDANFKPVDYQEAQELILGACQEAQRLYGWVSPEATKLIADHLGVTVNRIYGLLTFYADFRTAPPGRHFMLLCHGTACYVMGSEKLVQELQTTHGLDQDSVTEDGEFAVQIVNGCLGVCDLAPVAQIDHHQYCGHLTRERLNHMMEAIKHGEPLEEPSGAE